VLLWHVTSFYAALDFESARHHLVMLQRVIASLDATLHLQGASRCLIVFQIYPASFHIPGFSFATPQSFKRAQVPLKCGMPRAVLFGVSVQSAL